MADNAASQSAKSSATAPTAQPAAPADGLGAEERGQGPDRRQSRTDRRVGLDRRVMSREDSNYDGPERRVADRRSDTGLERRRGPGRRRSDDRKAAEEGEMTIEQFEFVMAVQTYKKVNHKLYPTWTEILEIVHQLGYRKVLARTVDLDGVPEPEISKVA